MKNIDGKLVFCIKYMVLCDNHVFSIRNHFISNLVLDSLKFKKILELHGKS